MHSYLAQLQSFVNVILRGFVGQYVVCRVVNGLRYYQPSCGIPQSHLTGFATLHVMLARWDRFLGLLFIFAPSTSNFLQS